jgi:hypothetical protein
MNIFYLDDNLEVCAQNHVNKHVVKMATEGNQLLSSAHWMTGSKAPYKLTHKNHPSSIWTRSCLENYLWLCNLTLELCKEYTFRYGKIHAGEAIANWHKTNLPELPKTDWFPPTPAMDDSDKIKINGSINSLLSYRNYYKIKKVHLHDWKNRNKPEWI